MAALKNLLGSKDLKFNIVESFLSEKLPVYSSNLDKELDTLFVYLQCPSGDVVAHFLDEYFAFLYSPETMEVIGMQVEDFSSFVEEKAAIKKGLTIKFSASKPITYADLSEEKAKKDYFIASHLLKAAEQNAKYAIDRIPA